MSPRAAWRLEALGFRPVYDYVAGKADWAAAGLPVEGTKAAVPRIGGLADTGVATCALDTWVRDTSPGAIVVNEERVVLGVVPSDAPADARVADVMREGPSTKRPNLGADEIRRLMDEHRLERVIVTTSDGRLVGVFRR